MFNFLIPSANAQGFLSNTATAAKNGAVEGAQTGLQGVLAYVGSNIDNWIAGIIILGVFYLLAQMATAAIKRTILKKRADVQEGVLILVERITKITVLILGVTIAFAINGLNFTAVIGALSLGIGFALKDIIGNFISGVIMLSQNRVNIGDFIKVKDILGTIVSIDTRATILQAIDGTEIVIPNQTMLGETLISYTTNPFRRVEIKVGVDYKTDLPMVTSLVKAILEKDENVVVKPRPSVLVDGFGESSIDLVIRFWVESSSNWLKTKSNMTHKIKQAFDEVGVNIPFPIRTLKLDEDDRAILKTMDSLKKGFVPEKSAGPTDEQLMTAALNTEHAVKIPYSIFGDEVKKTAEPKEEIKNTVNAPVQNIEIVTQLPLDHRINPAPETAPGEIPYAPAMSEVNIVKPTENIAPTSPQVNPPSTIQNPEPISTPTPSTEAPEVKTLATQSQ